MEIIDTIAMRELSKSNHASHTTLTGLVADGRTPWKWFEPVHFAGYYCDEEECPDDYTSECDAHPEGYWEEAMRRQWITNIRERGLTPVVDPDLVKEEIAKCATQ